MKIKTQFTVTMTFFGIILAAITISLVFTNRQVDRLQKQKTIAHDVELATRELSYLSNDYLLYREIHQRARWEARFSSFSNLLIRLNADDSEMTTVINEIKENQQRLKAVFDDVVSTLGSISSTKSIDVEMESIRVAWSRLEVQNQRMVFDASRLVRMLDESVDRMRQRNIILIFVLIGVFSASLVIEYSIVHRRILRAMSDLQVGTGIIGSGNLNFSIVENKKDEMGELACAFNRMTINLKNADRDLLKAREEVERAKRLSDIGALAATVAHELRNPLAAINMAASNIKRKAQNPLLEKHLENIEKKVLESDQIINNLLFYARIKAPHYEDININDIIDECVESARKQSDPNKEIAVTKDLDSTAGMLVGVDPLQIKETLLNILNNSYDAISGPEGEIEISTGKNEEAIEIFIKDNGSGIEKQNLGNVFDPFFTTKAKGTGLGLSVCKLIVSQHGGSIRIESAPGKGTSVHITLPKKKA